jgi:hypothetical protein
MPYIPPSAAARGPMVAPRTRSPLLIQPGLMAQPGAVPGPAPMQSPAAAVQTAQIQRPAPALPGGSRPVPYPAGMKGRARRGAPGRQAQGMQKMPMGPMRPGMPVQAQAGMRNPNADAFLQQLLGAVRAA